MTAERMAQYLATELLRATGKYEDFDDYVHFITVALMVGAEHYHYCGKPYDIWAEKDGKIIGKFKNSQEAAKKLGLFKRSIDKAMRGERKQLLGIKFTKHAI